MKNYIVEVNRHKLDDRKHIGVSKSIAHSMKMKSSKERVEKVRKDPHKVSR